MSMKQQVPGGRGLEARLVNVIILFINNITLLSAISKLFL